MKLEPPYKIEHSVNTSLGKVDFVSKAKDYYIIFEEEKLSFFSAFLYWWRNPSHIRETLLPEIKLVTDGVVASTDIGADMIGLAYIEPNCTKLIGSDVGYSDLELKTTEFYEIVLKWLEFLENHSRHIS